MGKIMKYSKIMALSVIAAWGILQAQPVRVEETLEAETAVLGDGMEIRTDQTASGKRYIHMPEKHGSAQFTLRIETKGRYAIYIGYRAPDADKAQHLIVNGKEYAPEIGFPMSRGWSEIRHAAGMKAGQNTIELTASRGDMDVDYLSVEGPVKEPAETTPARNTHYLDSDLDLSFQLDQNHNSFIEMTYKGGPVPFSSEPVWFKEDALRLHIPVSWLNSLEPGSAELSIKFDNGPVIFNIAVEDQLPETDWTIVSLDVRHGTAVIMILPTGKTLLIDTGFENMCRERVLPFMMRHDMKLDNLWITHHHPDHDGGLALLTETFPDMTVKDYHDFQCGDRFVFEGVDVLILNSYENGNDQAGENSRSLSFRMEYNGFVYTHGGDIYSQNQKDILNRYQQTDETDLLKTHVYHANHHFHGSVDVDYLKAISPCLFIVSGEEHIYGRGAYTTRVQQDVLPWLKENDSRWIEDLLQFEVGHVVIRIQDADHWNYETYMDPNVKIPL
jgi:competence protein ComEC